MKFLLGATLSLLLVNGLWAEDAVQPEEGFVSLFDGKSLDGWKVGDNAELFQVRDGMIVMDCPATNHRPGHLFYLGDVNHHDFKNFDLKVDVMTYPGATRAFTSILSIRRKDGPSSASSARSTTATRTGVARAAYGASRTSPGVRKNQRKTTRKTLPFCPSRR